MKFTYKKKYQRSSWEKDRWIKVLMIFGGVQYFIDNNDKYYYLSSVDMLANDWREIE